MILEGIGQGLCWRCQLGICLVRQENPGKNLSRDDRPLDRTYDLPNSTRTL